MDGGGKFRFIQLKQQVTHFYRMSFVEEDLLDRAVGLRLDFHHLVCREAADQGQGFGHGLLAGLSEDGLDGEGRRRACGTFLLAAGDGKKRAGEQEN